MCRILYNKNNIPFDKEELEISYRMNHDGTGLYYWNKNTNKYTVRKWEKGTPFEQIWKTISHLHQHKSVSNVAVHFRFGTSGGIGWEQTHPIRIDSFTFIMHNGVAPEFEWNRNLWSDTQCIAFWMKGMNDKNRSITSESVAKILSGNKVLVLNKNSCHIINENLGKWGDDGIWRSWNYVKRS